MCNPTLAQKHKHLGLHMEHDLSLEPSHQDCTWCCRHTEQAWELCPLQCCRSNRGKERPAPRPAWPLQSLHLPPVAEVWSFSGPSSNAYTTPWSKCEGDGDVVGVVAPLFAEVRRFLHGDQVVELSVLLEVHEKEEVGENGEGSERGELKERRTCTWMDMTGLRT